MGYMGSKTRTLSQILRKPCVRSRGHNFESDNHKNLVRMFVLMKAWTISKIGHVVSKTRSLGQMLDKPCVCSSGHILVR